MAGLAPIQAIQTALTTQQIQVQLQGRALRMQLDAAEQVGELALQLISAASINPDVGQNLDVTA